MSTLSELEQDLRVALTHLHDPLYQPSDLLKEVTDCQADGVECVRDTLIHAIRDLEPPASVPSDAPAHRLHRILHDRYVSRLTQAEVALRLGIGDRYLRKEQNKAIQLLARHLSMGMSHAVPGQSPDPHLNASIGLSSPLPWLVQVREELASLRKDDLAPLSDIGEIIRDAAETGKAIAATRGIVLEVSPTPADLRAVAHPTVLRQIVLEAIRELSRCVVGESVGIQAGQSGNSVTITVSGSLVRPDSEPNLDLIKELAAVSNASLTTQVEGQVLSLTIALPLAARTDQRVTVLIIDDNEDLIDLYRSYAAKTRYDIVPVGEARDVFRVIESADPQVIVLDIMLPDTDGWTLLAKMHEHPLSRGIPIMVCSVVRDEDLALALGAARYLAKPVRRRDFIGALDAALCRAAPRQQTEFGSIPKTW